MTIDAPEAVPAPGLAADLSGATDDGLSPITAVVGAGSPRDLRLLADVSLELSVQLGRARLPLRDLLALSPGSVLELDRTAGEPVDVLVNGHLIARGEVVVVDGDFGVRISEIADPHGGG